MTETDKIALGQLNNQLIKLGDMMGDGLHHESDGKWISIEYKKVFDDIMKIEASNGDEVAIDYLNKKRDLKQKRKEARWGNLQPQIETLLKEKKSVCCNEQLVQQRKSSLILQCTKCLKRYKLKTTKKKEIMKIEKPDDIIILGDESVIEYKTNIEGWVGKDGKYYGKSDVAKQTALYANSTHRKCSCGNLFKINAYCESCREKRFKERFLELEEVEWDGESALVCFDDDRYFYSLEDAHEYCEDNEIDIKDLMLVQCERKFTFAHINIDEMNEEYCTEEETFSDFHPEIAKKVDELNALLDNTKSKLWYATNKRIKV